MIKMLQAVENRIYHNEAAALKAKSLMNAVGILLTEIPPLLEKADEKSDGFTYVLFDLGKQMYNFASLIEGQVRKKIVGNKNFNKRAPLLKVFEL